jgi:hypothetical protein
LTVLAEQLGVQPNSVQWLPSERNKRARNLKNAIYGLPGNAIVVCVVGKVGHDVSGEVKTYASKRSLTLVEARFASQVLGGLADLLI